MVYTCFGKGRDESVVQMDGSRMHRDRHRVLSFDAVTAVMQKNSAGPWELSVEIVANGEVVQQTSTTAEYGVATLTWNGVE